MLNYDSGVALHDHMSSNRREGISQGLCRLQILQVAISAISGYDGALLQTRTCTPQLPLQLGKSPQYNMCFPNLFNQPG